MRPAAPAPEWLWRAADDIEAAGLGAEAAQLVAAIRYFRESAHLGATIGEALGLYTPPDMRPWWARSLAERRDDLLSELVQLLAGGSVREIAREVLRVAGRFESRGVLARCRGGRPPRDRTEAILLELHQVAKQGGPKWPLSDRQLRTLLGSKFGVRAGETAQASPLSCACKVEEPQNEVA